MGFLDKLKDAGKGALKGMETMSEKSYATVMFGKHKLCKISLNTTRDKLIFIKVCVIEEECVIKDSIRTFIVYPLDNEEKTFTLKLFYNDGEESDATIMIDENRGSALRRAEDRLAAQYSDISKLIEALAKNVPELDDNTKKMTNKIMRYAAKPDIF